MKFVVTSAIAAALALSACNSSPNHDHADHHAAVCQEDGVALAPLPADAKAADAKVVDANASQTTAHYGGEFKLADTDAVAADKVFATPADYRDKYVRVTGKVGAVCPKRGCWMRVVPAGEKSVDAQNIFIKFRDPSSGMLIPLEAVG